MYVKKSAKLIDYGLRVPPVEAEADYVGHREAGGQEDRESRQRSALYTGRYIYFSLLHRIPEFRSGRV